MQKNTQVESKYRKVLVELDEIIKKNTQVESKYRKVLVELDEIIKRFNQIIRNVLRIQKGYTIIKL